MKINLKAERLPVLMLGLGGLTLALLSLFYVFGTDEGGLLISGSPVPVAVCIIAALAVAVSGVSVARLDGSNRYADNFPPSVPGAVGSFIGAAGVLVTAIALFPDAKDPFSMIAAVLGVPSAAGLTLAGIARLRGSRPFVGCHGIFCLFFALYLVGRYRVWISDPQLLDYSFCLCACVALMLHAYHRTAFDAGSGHRRMTRFTGLLSVYLCCAALASGENRLLYLCCGAWALTNLHPMLPVKRRRAPSPQPDAGQSST